jgi:hypothetical protein
VKKVILILLFLSLLSGLARSEVLIVLKNGQSFTWVSYTEDEVRYCTWKDVGRRVCISKADVVSFTDIRNKKPLEGLSYDPVDEVWLEKETTERESPRDESEIMNEGNDQDADKRAAEDRKDAFRKAVEKDYKKRYYPSKYYNRR